MDRRMSEATCKTCSWAVPLSPGHAIICGEKWRHCEWNDAVPLTSADETCEHHSPAVRAALSPIRGEVDDTR